jgi:hypothetical protein
MTGIFQFLAKLSVMINLRTSSPKQGLKMQKPFSKVMLMLLTASLMLGSTACKTVTVIPSDRNVVVMPAGKSYTPKVDGWFVPNARMSEILDALDEKAIRQ